MLLYRLFIDFIVFLWYFRFMKKNMKQSNMISAQSLQRYQVEISEHDRVHYPYELEDVILSAISRGDRAKAYELLEQSLGLPDGSRESMIAQLKQTTQTSLGIMSRSRQKQEEYTVVLTVSFIARAAIRGGLDPYLAYNMNDLYLQKISETKDSADYWNILLDALDTYLGEVEKLLSTESRSVHVLHAKQYIGMNLNKDLSLTEIASAIGLSSSYLSAVFTQSEGIGIKEYIIGQRIEAAKNLLMYSDVDIGVIAAYVGFCSQSHFGKMFRRRTGMTPHQFRITAHK